MLCPAMAKMGRPLAAEICLATVRLSAATLFVDCAATGRVMPVRIARIVPTIRLSRLSIVLVRIRKGWIVFLPRAGLGIS